MEETKLKEILALVFDISKEKNTLRVRTWRELKRMKAELKFRSLWLLPNNKNNLSDFKNIRNEIRRNGGKADVLLVEVI